MSLVNRFGHFARHRFIAAAIVFGFCASGAVVYQASHAAFTGYTTNPGNAWTTGTVVLSDDDTGVDASTGTAMFTATNLVPGATLTKCIRVTYSGTSTTTGVHLYRSAHTDADTLLQYITMTIVEGTGTAAFSGTPDCTNFTADAGSSTIFNSTMDTFITKTTWAGGVYNTSGAWSPSSTATKVYKFTYTLSSGLPNAMQGKTANVAFRWEATST